MGGVQNLRNSYGFGNSRPEYLAFNNLNLGFTLSVVGCLLEWCWVGGERVEEERWGDVGKVF